MKTAVAMSGGIDSSTAIVLLKEMGHEVVGITARFFPGPASEQSITDAKAIADQLHIPHYIVTAEDDFAEQVVDPFCRAYLRGRTPNPCVMCNPKIKFKTLIEYARSLGCEKVATGHYSNIRQTDSGRFYISRGPDPAKDQTYFLFRLSQETLANILFPLGGYVKEKIREIAVKHNLVVADKAESQEICFIPDDDYAGFIENRTGTVPPPGDIVDAEGTVLGQHKGIHKYTIGQRRGLGISAPYPLYVVEIDAGQNRIIAGYKDELNKTGVLVNDITYMKATSLDKLDVYVKTRSTQRPVKARIEEQNEAGSVEIAATFEEAQTGISPGQAAVFYNEDGDVLGGGTIDKGL
ncbi:MAG: tRNA 2-thiouridine(34) synthase MnmA [bacterium]|nr:tRNA 2-thiouridine(34) synthase MnmA [bacterium]